MLLPILEQMYVMLSVYNSLFSWCFNMINVSFLFFALAIWVFKDSRVCSFSCLSLCSKFIEEPTKGAIVLVFKFEFIVCLCLGGQGKESVNPKSKSAFYAHLQT